MDSNSAPKPVPVRRQRIEKGIYRNVNVAGVETLELGWRDAQGEQRFRRVPGMGIRAARVALAEEHARRGRGERIAADPRLRFETAASAWFDARVSKLRPATQSDYRTSLKHLSEHFGRRRLVDVTPTEVARYITVKSNLGLKGSTIRGHLTALGSVYSYASRHLGFVGVNPVTLLDRVERPSRDDARPHRVLTTDEQSRLLSAVDPEYQLLYVLAVETGARLGEVLGLTWEHVDLDEDSVQFVTQLDRKGKNAPLKTARSRRWVEVTPTTARKLRALRLGSPRSGIRDLVFVSRAGTPLDHRNVAGRVLARAVKRAGLDAVERDGSVVQRAPTFHDLRHTHASALIAQGWDVEEVSARLGHANVAITQQTYVHAFDHARRSEDRRRRLSVLYPDKGTSLGGGTVVEHLSQRRSQP